MHSLLIAAAFLMTSSAADAQQSPKDALARLGIRLVEPMSARELAATKARVASELAGSGAASFFDDISDENGGKARHRPSGLVCPVGRKGQCVLSGSHNGASCETRGDGAVYKTKVERAPAGATLESVAAAVELQYAPGARLRSLGGHCVT